jgi:hypothetical protein
MTKILTMAVAALALSAGTARTQSDAVPYCDDLKQVIRLSASREKFASIVAKPREGNFSDTSLPLEEHMEPRPGPFFVGLHRAAPPDRIRIDDRQHGPKANWPACIVRLIVFFRSTS